MEIICVIRIHVCRMLFVKLKNHVMEKLRLATAQTDSPGRNAATLTNAKPEYITATYTPTASTLLDLTVAFVKRATMEGLFIMTSSFMSHQF